MTNIFNSLTEHILRPIKEFKINLTTLNIDQTIDLFIGGTEHTKAILEDYTAHWLGQVFDNIQQRNSLEKQEDLPKDGEDKNFDYLDKLNAETKFEPKSFDYVVVFISDKQEIESNSFLNEVKPYCVSEKYHPNMHSAQIVQLASKNVEFNRGDSKVLIFPIHYGDTFQPDRFSYNYLGNLISLQISVIKNIKKKKILLGFEFLKDLNDSEKKIFFRSLLRNLMQIHYQTYKINFENISILLHSQKDKSIFQSSKSDILDLLRYEGRTNDFGEYFSDHPIVKEYFRNSKLELPEPGKVDNEVLNVEEKIAPETIPLTNDILKEVSTNDQSFIKELKIIEKILDDNDSILLLGETGVGKSFLAEKIHNASNRSKVNFSQINCAAIPDTLIESELFGWEKGGHGTALEIRHGYIEQADKSTLFIDEIGKASLSVQQKLLTFLDNKKIYRLGGKKPIEIDVRLIFASNDNLKILIKQGKLLPEFYHRITAFPITIPPLRRRPEDIEKFILKFINAGEEKFKCKVTISKDIMGFLKSRPWNGNIRELKTTIQLMIVQKSIIEESIKLEDLEEILKRVDTKNEALGITSLESLEQALLEFFKKWLNHKDEIQGEVIKIYKRFGMKGPSDNQKSYGGSIIFPMLAKIFQENKDYLELDQRDASKSIGISWSGTKDNSTLIQKLNLYPVVEKFFKD